MTLVAILLAANDVTRRMDDIAYDLISQWNAATPDPQILIAAIDERSLAEFGQWPWPRALDGRLVEAIQRAEPKVIAFDALFIEPRPDDLALAHALNGGSPVFLPLAFEAPGTDGALFDLVEPNEPLRSAAAGLGHINLVASDDAVVRRARLWEGAGGRYVPHLMEKLAREFLPWQGKKKRALSTAPVLLPFVGPAGTYPEISAAAILNGEVPPDLIRGRAVLIGVTASGLSDWHPTSVRQGNGMMSGVEIQANLLDAIRHARLVNDASVAQRVAFAITPLWLLLLSFRRNKPGHIVALMAALLLTSILVSVAVLLFARIWLPPAAAVAPLLAAYPLWGWRRLSALHDFLAIEVERLESPAGAERADFPLPVDRTSRQAALLRNAVHLMQRAQYQRELMLQFLSHDMRAPQSLIISLVNSSSSDEISPDVAQRISSYAARTLDLADSVVNLARAEADTYRLEILNPSDVLIEAADHLWPLFKSKALKVTLPNGEDARRVLGDGSMLFRVFVNLLHNAYKHSPVEGTILCRLSVDASRSLPMVIFSVEDQGGGVPEALQPSLFLPFAAADTPDRQPSSVGLGLAFARTVVERHGGAIWYEPVGGAKFSLALPIHTAGS